MLLIGETGVLTERIDDLNADPRVAGIVVAQPLADRELGARLVAQIDPAKDVDGATPTNAGWLARGEPAFVPATALAVIAILEGYGVPIAAQRAVIIGRSAVVGRPVASLLVARDADRHDLPPLDPQPGARDATGRDPAWPRPACPASCSPRW